MFNVAITQYAKEKGISLEIAKDEILSKVVTSETLRFATENGIPLDAAVEEIVDAAHTYMTMRRDIEPINDPFNQYMMAHVRRPTDNP
jgi:hypothetical protein